MGRKMTKLDNSNKLFLHTLGNQVGRAKIQRNRDIKKNRFMNTIQTISKKTKWKNNLLFMRMEVMDG